MNTGGFAYAIGAAIIWGLVYTIDQKILQTLSASTLLFITSIFGLAVALPLMLLDSTGIHAVLTGSRKTLLLIVLSQTLLTVASYCIYSSIKLLGASAASLLEISYPLFVVLFSYLLLGSRLTLTFWIGGCLIAIGAVIVLLPRG